MKLHFKHLSTRQIDSYAHQKISDESILQLADQLTARLQQTDLQLAKLNHAGFKDFTEGPAEGTPILLRQDAYKALTEPVVFQQPDGSTVNSAHTARFGEIEQRFYATTPAGRKLYDECLATGRNCPRAKPQLGQTRLRCLSKRIRAVLRRLSQNVAGVLEKKLVYGRFTATAAGLAACAAGSIQTNDLNELIQLGYVHGDGLRYEDFLPVSAAGIFASNLGQYGTKSTASTKPAYSREMLEEILGRKIIEADDIYSQLQVESIRNTYEQLGLTANGISHQPVPATAGAV